MGTITIHLGVIDIPYADEGGKTTGDVAEILEGKYHIMEIFAQEHLDDAIMPALNESLQGALETALMGGPVAAGPYNSGLSAIENRFRNFLDSNEMNSLGYPGIPTAASGQTSKRKGGINHRLKHPYAQANPARPSFVDSGLYQSSFRAWMDE